MVLPLVHGRLVVVGTRSRAIVVLAPRDKHLADPGDDPLADTLQEELHVKMRVLAAIAALVLFGSSVQLAEAFPELIQAGGPAAVPAQAPDMGFISPAYYRAPAGAPSGVIPVGCDQPACQGGGCCDKCGDGCRGDCCDNCSKGGCCGQCGDDCGGDCCDDCCQQGWFGGCCLCECFGFGHGCDSCGHGHFCGAGCKDCASCWRLRLENLYLDRDETDFPQLTTIRNIGGMATPALGIGDLEFDPYSSIKAALEYNLGGGCSVEFLYFGLHNWTDEATTSDPAGQLFSPYFNVGPPAPGLGPGVVIGYDNAFIHRISYSSDVSNAEINFWKPIKYTYGGATANFVYGARYFRLEEGFIYDGFAANRSATTIIETDNNLVGGQIGLLAVVPLDCNWSVRFEGKAGLFANIAEQQTNINSVRYVSGRVDVNYSEEVEHEDTALVSEMTLVLNYRVTCNASVYAGASVLFTDGLVLAPEQLSAQFPTNGLRTVTIDNTGQVDFFGMVSGVEFMW